MDANSKMLWICHLQSLKFFSPSQMMALLMLIN